MPELSFTLISDGSSDRALLPILKWALVQNGVRAPILGEWVDWGRFRAPPRDLASKIRCAIEWYPCKLLFIHRDAEKASLPERQREILRAVEKAKPAVLPPHVCIVPVRMMEAWLLIDEPAIREASGNPMSACALELPRWTALEALPDPKARLHELLREASGLQGRHRRKFRVEPAVHRLADLIEDFSPLRELPAFRALEADLQSVVLNSEWTGT